MQKRVMALMVITVFVAGNAFATTTNITTEDQIVPQGNEYKSLSKWQARKLAREEKRKTEGPTFWEIEGERSGLNRFGERVKGMSLFNPVAYFKEQDRKYKERKYGSAT